MWNNFHGCAADVLAGFEFRATTSKPYISGNQPDGDRSRLAAKTAEMKFDAAGEKPVFRGFARIIKIVDGVLARCDSAKTLP